MTARPDPFKTHVAGQVLAALAEGPMSTPAIQDRTGYGARYGQLVYTVLTRLAKAREVEKITAPGVRPVYWRRILPVISLPPFTVRSEQAAAMTGPQHWEEAGHILTDDPCEYGCPHSGCPHEMRMIARAQVHALLALAEAFVAGATMRPEDRDEWDRATGRRDQIAEVTR